MLVGPDIVRQAQEVVEQIRKIMKAAQDRQKSYADLRRRELEFKVDDLVFLKVSPTKGTMRFGKKGKLSPRYVGPFPILKRVGEVAYELALPPHLSAIHPVFHISVLRKYITDPSHIIGYEEIELQPNLSYEEQALRILDHQEKKLRNKMVKLVRVQWKRRGVEEST